MATCRLGFPISTKMLNFNKFVDSLDLNVFISNLVILPCECASLLFADRYHNHTAVQEIFFVKAQNTRRINCLTWIRVNLAF